MSGVTAEAIKQAHMAIWREAIPALAKQNGVIGYWPRTFAAPQMIVRWMSWDVARINPAKRNQKLRFEHVYLAPWAAGTAEAAEALCDAALVSCEHAIHGEDGNDTDVFRRMRLGNLPDFRSGLVQFQGGEKTFFQGLDQPALYLGVTMTTEVTIT